MMPIIGIKCDKYVTKSQGPHHPLRGTPLLRYLERDTIPRKNIHATMFYKNVGVTLRVSDCEEYGDFTWRVTDCEELVGGRSITQQSV